MMLPDGAIIDVRDAEYIGDFKLHLYFSDGKSRVVDFGIFLNKSLNPLIRRYLDISEFKNFTVASGDLFWNDYDLCFSVADLYEGRI